jgi:hypothetical protein
MRAFSGDAMATMAHYLAVVMPRVWSQLLAAHAVRAGASGTSGSMTSSAEFIIHLPLTHGPGDEAPVPTRRPPLRCAHWRFNKLAGTGSRVSRPTLISVL